MLTQLTQRQVASQAEERTFSCHSLFALMVKWFIGSIYFSALPRGSLYVQKYVLVISVALWPLLLTLIKAKSSFSCWFAPKFLMGRNHAEIFVTFKKPVRRITYCSCLHFGNWTIGGDGRRSRCSDITPIDTLLLPVIAPGSSYFRREAETNAQHLLILTCLKVMITNYWEPHA